MAKDIRKKPKKGGPAPKKPRNPFAGKPQSGAGYHSEAKYGKRDRREEKKEIEEETDPPAESSQD
ncbi:MAG: hypothetical protein HZB44_02820 [Actinobacteria bacterium]|nr:hypothetical protein [Actinomycetota bacterium]